MSAKKSLMVVQGAKIALSTINHQDYISLTDMVKGAEGDDHIRNWMRNKNTIEFLGVWEQLHNPNFKGVGFDTFLQEAGLNRFNMTPRKWIDGTNAIGIISKPGRNGGTLAHKDIAFEFGAWISPIFKLYLITEYQRLKEQENCALGFEWNVKRVLAKANYTLHTDAIKEHIIPKKNEDIKDEYIYASEADFLNYAVFGCCAKEWRVSNEELANKGLNIRDAANINELAVLSNMESLNAILIKQGLRANQRIHILKKEASEQLERLNKTNIHRQIQRAEHKPIVDTPLKTTLDGRLNQALSYNPKKDKRNDNEDREE